MTLRELVTLAQRVRGTAYRAHTPRWAAEPLSGAGAARHGGRFNPVGTPALYTALSVETAWREAQQGFAFKAQPCTMVAYDVDHHRVLDATRTEVLARLGIPLDGPWRLLRSQGREPPTWRLALDLIAAGIGAMVVPSVAPGAQPGDRNLVFWRWNTGADDRVTVIDDFNRLPRNGQSWP